MRPMPAWAVTFPHLHLHTHCCHHLAAVLLFTGGKTVLLGLQVQYRGREICVGPATAFGLQDYH